MSEPKSWDGISQIGSHFSRALDRLGEAKSDFTTEFREDGTLGQVAIKQRAGVNHVHREGGPPPTDEPFLCTWQDAKVTFVDKTLPPRNSNFVAQDRAELTMFVGGSAFVGDGFLAGVVSTSDVLGRVVPVLGRPDALEAIPVEFAVLLMRLPATSPGRDAATVLDPLLSVAERRKMSVWVGPITVQNFQSAYIVPMGWKNDTERYAFALVLETLIQPDLVNTFVNGRSFVLAPRVWLGNTGTFALQETPDRQGLDFTWVRPTEFQANFALSAPTFSRVYSTGPGRLEFIVFRPEDNTTTEIQPPVTLGTVPVTYAHKPDPGDDLFLASSYSSGSATGITHYQALSIADRRPSMSVASTTDFGATWVLVPEPAFEDGTLELPPPPAGHTTPGILPGSIPVNIFPTHLGSYSTWPGISQPYGGNLTLPGERFTQRIKTRIEYPPTPAASSRGNAVRPRYENYQIVGAGATTFAVLAGLGELRNTPSRTGHGIDYWGFLNGRGRGIIYPGESTDGTNSPDQFPHSEPNTTYFGDAAPRLYRRSGSGSFARIAWPGDALSNQWTAVLIEYDGGTGRVGIQDVPSVLTTEGVVVSNASHHDVRRAASFSLAWLSTGEGRAAFFFMPVSRFEFQSVMGTYPVQPDADVTMFATIDGGDSWTTLTLVGALGLRDFCLLAATRREGCSILYAMEGALPGTRQLMQISADFTTVKRYGNTYTSKRGGLVNFQKYVHPGFPGLYDGPHAQPPRAT